MSLCRLWSHEDPEKDPLEGAKRAMASVLRTARGQAGCPSKRRSSEGSLCFVGIIDRHITLLYCSLSIGLYTLIDVNWVWVLKEDFEASRHRSCGQVLRKANQRSCKDSTFGHRVRFLACLVSLFYPQRVSAMNAAMSHALTSFPMNNGALAGISLTIRQSSSSRGTDCHACSAKHCNSRIFN